MIVTISVEDLQFRPGSTYVNDGRLCMVLAVFDSLWSSTYVLSHSVDTCLVLEGARVYELQAKDVQAIVQSQRRHGIFDDRCWYKSQPWQGGINYGSTGVSVTVRG